MSVTKEGYPVNNTRTSTFTQQQGGMSVSQLWAMLTPWRWWLALVAVSVLLGGCLRINVCGPYEAR